MRYITSFFRLERGTRQGDPWSAFLFILCLETLFIQIRDNESIKGININTYQIKLSACADGADFLASDAMSLGLIRQTCANSQTFSSLKLNVEKCEACWIGAEKDNPAKPINSKWVNIASEAIRTLGIYNTYDRDLVEKLNFLDNLKPYSDVISAWESRGLSLAGKILVFKTLAVSELLYVCTFKNSSTQIIESPNSIQKKFILSKKRPKIKHSQIIKMEDIKILILKQKYHL